MKKLLFLSALLVYTISLSYGKNATENNSSLMNRLVMNQRLLTGHSSVNYSVVTHKMHAHVFVIDHTFLNKLRMNAMLITGFLNTTLTGTLNSDYGSDPEYGETWSYDIDVDVDNNGMVHETDVLNIPSATWPSGLTLTNSQIHVSLSYGPPSYGGTTNTYQYVENYPGIFDGGTTLTCDYQAADLQDKRIDLDWGDAAVYQPARTIDITY